MRNDNTSTLSAIAATLLALPVGAALGVLAWREYERYREERFFIENNTSVGFATMGPPPPPGEPETDVTCSVCSHQFTTRTAPGYQVECPNCGHMTDV